MYNPVEEIKSKMRFLLDDNEEEFFLRVVEAVSPLLTVENNCRGITDYRLPPWPSSSARFVNRPPSASALNVRE